MSMPTLFFSAFTSISKNKFFFFFLSHSCLPGLFNSYHFEGHSRSTHIELLCGFMVSFTYLFSCFFIDIHSLDSIIQVYHVCQSPPLHFLPFPSLLPKAAPVYKCNVFYLFIAVTIDFLPFPTSSPL